ncbi:MAG TPA: potassium-transporting ATPase subunit C, partial [Solirubrobacteraceae bacterium]|nr:potassium-transporting ATPase subunit C [Solirubrobacteraceae bacterium]
MVRQLRSAVLALVIFTLLLGLGYPLVITGVSQVLWSRQANGSKVQLDGRTVGSSLIGQDFAGDP